MSLSDDYLFSDDIHPIDIVENLAAQHAWEFDRVTDDQIDAFIAEHVESALHPSCTCKMGSPRDPMAVVDPELRVIGVQGLRVVDSGVMPSITTGNLNAPTIMIGEKGADHILGKPMLPPSNAPFYVAPNWEVTQR